MVMLKPQGRFRDVESLGQFDSFPLCVTGRIFPIVALDGFSPLWHGWIFPTVARDGRIGEVEKFDWRQPEN